MDRNTEMISRSGNETVPMWAIAARTMGRVKEIDDDDQGTRRAKKKTYRSNTRSALSMNMLLFPRSFLFPVALSASS